MAHGAQLCALEDTGGTLPTGHVLLCIIAKAFSSEVGESLRHGQSRFSSCLFFAEPLGYADRQGISLPILVICHQATTYYRFKFDH